MLSAAQSARAQGYYRVDLEPDTAKRRAIPIEFGSYSANLWLYPPASWQIGDSAIVAQDDTLWTGPTRSGPHVYHMLNAYSSREYVVVYGNLVKPGGGPGYSPWFHVTVPAVDVDWNGYTAKADETGEDSREIYCPVTTNKTLWKRLLIQRPSDDTSLVPPTLTLTYPAGSLTLRKADGTAVSSGWSFNAGTVQTWPVTLYADPVAGQGNYRITLKGSSDGVNQPEDHVMGRGLTVDLDVDANYDGGISAADEALEESAGGILCANTDDDDWNGTADKDDPGPAELEDDLLPIQLALDPSDAGSGQLKLEAVSGGSKIRLWGNSDKTGQVTLPKTWALGSDTVPGTLYVEGLAASDAMRDIALRLRYTDPKDTAAYCEDSIKLTSLGVDLDVDSDYDGAITDADEALEESAGGIAAVGGGLCPVNVRLSPAGLASGTLTLTLFAESQNKIRVWPSNSTNGAPLSLPKTWTVGTDTVPTTLYVQGVAASSYPRDLELVLSYTDASHAVGYFSDSIRMTVVKVDLKSVDFLGTGNHTLYKQDADAWENDKFGDDGNVPIDYPEWQDSNCDGTPEKDEPVCYTRSSAPKMTAILAVSPSLTTAVSSKLRVRKGATTIVAKDVSLSGAETAAANLDWTTALAATLLTSDYTLLWQISLDGGTTYADVGTSVNRFFVVLNTPIQVNSFGQTSKLTCRRISEVLDNAGGATADVGSIASSIQSWRDHYGINNWGSTANTGAKVWALLDLTESGQCAEGSVLMEQAIRLLGITAEYQHVLPAVSLPVPILSANSAGIAPTRTHDSTTETLNLFFPLDAGDPFNGWNIGEGCCLVDAKLYSAWASGLVGETGGMVSGTVAVSAAHHILLQLESSMPTLQRWRKANGAACDSGDTVPVPKQ